MDGIGEYSGGTSLSPPPNFGEVVPGVFRSAMPSPENFAFLETLELRSIIYLCHEPYPEENMEFVRYAGIQLFQFGIEGNKDPLLTMSEDIIMEALVVLIAMHNHPVLIHCKRGKHRTGCLVGCFRKLFDFSLDSVLEEYHQYATAKARISDLRFIKDFDAMCFKRYVLARYHEFDCEAKLMCYDETC